MTRMRRFPAPAGLMALALMFAGAWPACTRGGERPDDTTRAQTTAARDTAPPGEAVARARGIANALGRDLSAKLFAALDSGGPARAITYCADSAQALSAQHAREGAYVRRVSLRVRNAANRPDAAEEQLLRRLDSLHRAGAMPGEVVRWGAAAGGARVVEYARPILVQERCLACHGDPAGLPTDVRRLLAERYPADRATGYEVGDLRGMLSVRVRP